MLVCWWRRQYGNADSCSLIGLLLGGGRLKFLLSTREAPHLEPERADEPKFRHKDSFECDGLKAAQGPDGGVCAEVTAEPAGRAFTFCDEPHSGC